MAPAALTGLMGTVRVNPVARLVESAPLAASVSGGLAAAEWAALVAEESAESVEIPSEPAAETSKAELVPRLARPQVQTAALWASVPEQQQRGVSSPAKG